MSSNQQRQRRNMLKSATALTIVTLAGAVIGIDIVRKSPADGYTFGLTTSGAFFQNRVLFTKLPLNVDKDIAPVTFFPAGALLSAEASATGLPQRKRGNGV